MHGNTRNYLGLLHQLLAAREQDAGARADRHFGKGEETSAALATGERNAYGAAANLVRDLLKNLDGDGEATR